MSKQKLSNKQKAFSYCPHCKCKLSDGNFIVLNGGSMVKIGDSKYSSDNSLLPFLNLIWHEYLPQKNEHGAIESSVFLEVTDKKNHILGQFEYNFCSIECIREWFNSKLEELSLAAKDRGLTKLRTRKKKTEQAKSNSMIEAIYRMGSKMPKENIDKLKKSYGIK